MSRGTLPILRIPASEKPRHYVLEQVADVLGSNFYGFERLKVMAVDGKFVVRYKNTGSMVVGNVIEKETKTVKNASLIVAWEVAGPLIVSAHENDNLQTVNCEIGQTEVFSPKTSLFPLKKTQAIFIREDYIYCVASNGLVVFDRKNMKAQPREVPLIDVKDPNTRPIINVNNSYSGTLSNSKLMLGNMDVFQIWSLIPEKCEMFLEFEGRNPSSTVKYLNIWQYDNTVVTYSRGSLALFQVDKPKDLRNPREMKEDNLVTELFIDDSFIITGDNTGNITLRQRVDGERVYELPAGESTGFVRSSKEDVRLVEFNLENKINSLTKIGRWVIAATENGKIVVYDVIKEKAPPVIEYISPKPGPISSLLVDYGVILASFKNKSGNPDKKKDKESGSAKEKPEVISWAPKLAGIDYYIEANKNGRDSIASILSWTLKQITSFIKAIEREGEDITELSTTTDRLDDSISQTRKYPELAVQFFSAIRKLQTSLDSYEALLEKLTQQGRLVRIFTSSRLRRDIEYQNSVVGTNVIELELRIKTTLERKTSITRISPTEITKTTPISAQTTPAQVTIPHPVRQSMIQDVGGKAFWSKNWGDALHVLWDDFIVFMVNEFPGFNANDERHIRMILDYSNTGSVSQYKFAEFLKGFGPFEHSVANVTLILNEPWFHGFLNGRESELLMRNQYEPDGTFLVRFSKSKPGSFALAFLKDSVVNHILVESFMPEGFKVLTQDTSGVPKIFKTLHELISHYSFVLKYPFHSDLPKQEWFHGDITTDEAIEVLKDKPFGTFLIRFSSKGTFAASFVDGSNAVRHVLIATEGKNSFVVDTGAGALNFKGIPDLVRYYTEKQVFVHPLISGK